jgi:hypothetical protein
MVLENRQEKVFRKANKSAQRMKNMFYEKKKLHALVYRWLATKKINKKQIMREILKIKFCRGAHQYVWS